MWIVELEEHSFTVEYIDSQRNVVADALSRLGYDQDSRMGESNVVCRQDGGQVNPIAVFVPQSLTSSVNVLKADWSVKEFRKAHREDVLLGSV